MKDKPTLRLGKAPAVRDPRNLKFAAIRRDFILPLRYDFDDGHPGVVPTPMFANDEHGCCVMAARAHNTIRFELMEQGRVIPISDADVLGEYFRESGGRDSGLVMLNSLTEWRRGWKAARRTYRSAAFAEVNRRDHDEVRAGIWAHCGIQVGLQLPLSAHAQLGKEPWDIVPGPDGSPGTWGGHAVYVPGYNETGPICVTWGSKQQMTWEFWDRCCDEAYFVTDALDRAPRIKPDVVTEHVNRVAPVGWLDRFWQWLHG